MTKITRIYLLPIINFFWFAASFVITYVLAVHLDHVNGFFPLISDSGTYHPERCLYAQLINVGCIFMSLIVYIRYRNVEELSKIYGFRRYINVINSTCLWIGLVSCLGISILANFQQATVRSIHFLGAILGFGLGTGYQILHTTLCLLISRKTGSTFINLLRILISIIGTISLILFGTFLIIKIIILDSSGYTRLKVNSNHEAFVPHIISAFAEWKLAFCNIGYFLTFIYEFKEITLYEPEIDFKSEIVTDITDYDYDYTVNDE